MFLCPEPFLSHFWYPPKCPKCVILGVFGHFGGTENEHTRNIWSVFLQSSAKIQTQISYFVKALAWIWPISQYLYFYFCVNFWQLYSSQQMPLVIFVKKSKSVWKYIHWCMIGLNIRQHLTCVHSTKKI